MRRVGSDHIPHSPRLKINSSGIFVALLMSFLFCTSAFAQTKSTETQVELSDADRSGGSPESTQKIEIEPQSNDKEIQSRILKILEASKWFEQIHVEVDEGVVFLEGTVTEKNNRDWAGEMSRNVEDVVAVVNNIKVREADSFDLQKASSHVTKSLGVLWRDFLERLPLLAVGIIILGVTWLAYYAVEVIVRRSARKAGLRPSLQDLLAQVSTFVTWVLGLTIAAVIIFPGMTPAKLLTVLGLGSVALGFAFKDIFENFFAGILILWRFPFEKGDFIECGDITGNVEDVTIRMTTIRQVDGQLVVVPNALLFKNPVCVLTNMDLRRTTIICGIAYSEDVDRCRDIIEQAVKNCPTVATLKPVEIFAQEFASSSINFEVTWWTGSTPLEIRRSKDEVIANVKRTLDEANIEIPFPHRTLTFKHPLPFDGKLNVDANQATVETENDSEQDS